MTPPVLSESERELVRQVAELVLTPAEQRELLVERKPSKLFDVIAELNLRGGARPEGGPLQVLLSELRAIYGLADAPEEPTARPASVESPAEARMKRDALEAALRSVRRSARLKEPTT